MASHQIVGENQLTFSGILNSTHKSTMEPTLDNIHDLQLSMLQESLITGAQLAMMMEEATEVEP